MIRTISLGTSRWHADTTDGPWTRGDPAPFPLFGVYWRFGDPGSSLRGKLLRGVSVAGRAHGTIIKEPIGMLRGVRPSPAGTWPFGFQVNTAVSRSVEYAIPDYALPIGVFPNQSAAYSINGTDWVGMESAMKVRRDGNEAPGQYPYLEVTRAVVRVSDKMVVAGKVSGRRLTVRAVYPPEEGVQGMQLTFSGGVQRTETTDELGMIEFDLPALPQGTIITVSPGPNADAAWFGATMPMELTVSVGAEDLPPPAPPPDSCTTYPAIPPTPFVPGRLEPENSYGWNAGGNSVVELEGDAVLAFDGQPPAVGAVIGLTGTRDDVGITERMTHAFYFHYSNDQPRVQVMESGKVFGNARAHSSSNAYRIQRIGGVVSYFIDDELVYTSRTPSTGLVLAGCATYAAGDQVPS